MVAKLSKGELTRERILQAAETIFAKVGYESATLREVARVASMHQPGIYNYFKTKRELYKAVLNRMLHPLVNVLEDIQHMPTTGRARSTTKLVDLLSENRNIASLLVRAFLSTNHTERDIAVKWTMRVMAASPSSDLHRSGMRTRSLPEILKDMAVLNAWLGYFWTAPIVESVTGRKITDQSLLAAQKDLLIYMISKF
jgi:AcrR family transcriptional regulator